MNNNHTLSMKLVEIMVTNYKNHQLKAIESSPSSPMAFDATAAVFTLEQLKSFIKTIEEEVGKHPDTRVENIGIRFYYAAYPAETFGQNQDTADIATVDPSYAKLHTLIAVPTTEIKGVICDFDPYDKNTYSGAKPSGTTVAIMAENHGALVPPRSKVGQWF
jgi:hypothetical protein